MFSFMKPEIAQVGQTITISGINGKKLIMAIKKMWGTRRIENYLISSVSWRKVSFLSFFALDFYHLLDTMIEKRPYGVDVVECEEIQRLLKQETWLVSLEMKHKSRLDRSRLSLFKFKPLPHQEEVFSYYDTVKPKLNLKGALINAAPGTGKTYTSLAIAEMLCVDVVVVVCPNNAVTRVWDVSISDAGKDGLYKSPNAVWTTHQNRDYSGERFIVIHYEALGYALDMVKEIKKRGRGIIILDECHNLNEIDSARTARFIALCQMLNFDDNIFMSGTPLKAMSNELIPFFRVTDPTFTEHVELRFKSLFKGNATSNAATDLLTRRLGYASFYVDKSATNITEPIEETIPIRIKGGEAYTLTAIGEKMKIYIEEQQKFYASIKEETDRLFYTYVGIAKDVELAKVALDKDKARIRSEYSNYLTNVNKVIDCYHKRQLFRCNSEMAMCSHFERTRIIPNLSNSKMKSEFKEAKAIVKYVDLKIRGECLGRVVGGARIEAHVLIAQHIDYRAIVNSTKKKTLIFSSYVEVNESAKEACINAGYKPLTVYADNTTQLSEIVSKFSTDPKANPLIASYASLSTAVPLVMADTMIIINPPFRDYVMKQTIARVARIGQDSQTKIYHIMLDTGEEPNISTRNIDIMQWSREQVNDILGLGGVEVDEGEDESVVAKMGLAQEALIEDRSHLSVSVEKMKPSLGSVRTLSW